MYPSPFARGVGVTSYTALRVAMPVCFCTPTCAGCEPPEHGAVLRAEDLCVRSAGDLGGRPRVLCLGCWTRTGSLRRSSNAWVLTRPVRDLARWQLLHKRVGCRAALRQRVPGRSVTRSVSECVNTLASAATVVDARVPSFEPGVDTGGFFFPCSADYFSRGVAARSGVHPSEN